MAFKGQAANNKEHDPGAEAGSSNDRGGTLTEHGKLKRREKHETQEESLHLGVLPTLVTPPRPHG